MPYPGITFRAALPPHPGLSPRADVALFVGLVARRATKLPATVLDELTEYGWAGQGPFTRPDAQVDALLDVPVAVESWAAFDALFAWNVREVAPGDPRRVPCPLGLAVRSFFNEGGRRAYVVRMGDPLPLGDVASAEDKRGLLRTLLPSLDLSGAIPDANDARTWHGAALAWGVDQAAFLSLPDLPELCADPPLDLPLAPDLPDVEEHFHPCAPIAATAEPAPRPAPPALSAPRLDRDGYARWATAIRHALHLLNQPRGRAARRDVMLLAALPLPSHSSADGLVAAEAWPLALLDAPGLPEPGARLLDRSWLGSARLQLAYPWLATEAAQSLPEGVESPEGALAGVLARTALAAGAFRSAAGSDLPSIIRTLPDLGPATLRRGLPDGRSDWLGDRICVIGRRRGAIALLSDATASTDRSWRAGGVSRLMGLLLRASRTLGQDRLFEPAGPALWQELRAEIETYLEDLRLAGALAGAGAEDAYTVRCDETTMRPADIDAGRVVVHIAFTAAQPIARITVTLAMDDAGLALREAA